MSVHIKNSMHPKKKEKFSMLKGKESGDEVVRQISLALPQIQLALMEPNFSLASTKLDFVTNFSDFCDAKIWVNDSFRFEAEKNIPSSFVFLLQ